MTCYLGVASEARASCRELYLNLQDHPGALDTVQYSLLMLRDADYILQDIEQMDVLPALALWYFCPETDCRLVLYSTLTLPFHCVPEAGEELFLAGGLCVQV